MTATMERTGRHSISLLEGEIVEESDLGSIRCDAHATLARQRQ